MNGFELDVIDEYLVDLLNADATIVTLLGGSDRVFVGSAPPKTSPPFIIVSDQSTVDRSVIGGRRIVTRPLYWVRAVTQSKTYVSAGAIATRVDQLLQETHGNHGGLRISCEGREMPIRTYEMDQGNRWNYVGGFYRFFVSELAP